MLQGGPSEAPARHGCCETGLHRDERGGGRVGVLAAVCCETGLHRDQRGGGRMHGQLFLRGSANNVTLHGSTVN